MLRSSINFMLKLGKHRELQPLPSVPLSDQVESASALVPVAQKIMQAPLKTGQPQHSNQMSS